MADIKDFKHAIVRQKILDAVRKDLIGPASDCEQLNEVPTSSYITGLLYPADTDVTEDENYNDVEFTEKNFDADGETLEAGIFEEEEPEDRVKGGFQKPSSIGVSFYVSDDVQKINAYINWGKYYTEQVQGEVIDETLEEDAENKKKKKHTIYIREQMNDVVEIDFNEMGRSKQIPLESNGNIYIYVMKMQLDNGYKMVSVYLHNNDKSDGDEKEYEKVMFQVEMLIADDLMSPIFVPEYLCRKVELEDEYYYIETLQNITDIFLSLLSVIDSIKFHSSDYLDALEMGMKPQEGSQYWVCPIIVEYMNDRFDKKLLQYIQNNEGNGMQFMAEYYAD